MLKYTQRKRAYIEIDGVITEVTCTKCSEMKSVSEFASDSSKALSVGSRCKVCERNYREDNKQAVSERKRKSYYGNWEHYKQYREDNSERIAEKKRKFRRDNPEKNIEYKHRRRANERQLPDGMDTQRIRLLFMLFNGSCALTGKRGDIHLDHVIPISSGKGGNTFNNLIPLNSSLNCSKHNANIFEWYERNKERYKISDARFRFTVRYLAQINGMTPDQYEEYVYEQLA